MPSKLPHPPLRIWINPMLASKSRKREHNDVLYIHEVAALSMPNPAVEAMDAQIGRLREAASTALRVLTNSGLEYALVDINRPNYTICDLLREALGLPPQDRSDWT